MENIKTHILCSVTFFENRAVYDNVEKSGGDWVATNGVTTSRISVGCWISKATCTRARAHTQMSDLLLFHGNNDSQTRLSVTLYVHCMSFSVCDGLCFCVADIFCAVWSLPCTKKLGSTPPPRWWRSTAETCSRDIILYIWRNVRAGCYVKESLP